MTIFEIEELDVAHVTDEQAAAIGRLALSFNFLESCIDEAISFIISPPDASGIGVLTARLGFDAKVSRLEAIVKHFRHSLTMPDATPDAPGALSPLRIWPPKHPSGKSPSPPLPCLCSGFGPKGARIEVEGSPLPRQFDVVIERDEEGYYIASVPQLPGCHTQARSLDEVTQRIREAVELCLEVAGAPEQTLEFVGIQRITIAA
jgi:predicted RNase H-like HicB family nuclease